VIDPLFWLGLSILLVATSLTAVLVAAIPALQELARAARSAEKLFDTISRELPPTLNAIRMTSLEITDLTDDVSEGVKSAGQVVKQVDQSLDSAKKQAQNVQTGTRSVFVGFKAAWKTFTRQKPTRRTSERLPASDKPPLTLREREASRPDNRRKKPEAYSANNGYIENEGWDNDYEDEDVISKSIVAEDWSEQ
jgi:ABC-type transporter Mla subunit MlaD